MRSGRHEPRARACAPTPGEAELDHVRQHVKTKLLI